MLVRFTMPGKDSFRVICPFVSYPIPSRLVVIVGHYLDAEHVIDLYIRQTPQKCPAKSRPTNSNPSVLFHHVDWVETLNFDY
jgi:hypothetical protein